MIEDYDWVWTPGTLYIFISYGQFYENYIESPDGNISLERPIYSLNENRPVVYLLFIEVVFDQDEWRILKFLHDGKFVYISERQTFNVFPVSVLEKDLYE